MKYLHLVEWSDGVSTLDVLRGARNVGLRCDMHDGRRFHNPSRLRADDRYGSILFLVILFWTPKVYVRHDPAVSLWRSDNCRSVAFSLVAFLMLAKNTEQAKALATGQTFVGLYSQMFLLMLFEIGPEKKNILIF